MNTPETWYVIDADNWFAICDYASPGSASSNMVKRARALREQARNVSAVFFCWDLGISFRHKLSATYKAGRAAKPDGYYRRQTEARLAIEAAEDFISVSVDGYEADDCIASIVRRAIDEGIRAAIFSADSDLHQLLVRGQVTQVTSVRRLSRTETECKTTTAEQVVAKWGVEPWQWVEFRAIVGDSSDNIRGVHRVGKVAAAAILSKCGTLERFYARPYDAKITPRERAAVLAAREQLSANCELIRLVDSLPAVALSGAAQ